jgi:Fur family transcriptional regulator, ferric uptake regulator
MVTSRRPRRDRRLLQSHCTCNALLDSALVERSDQVDVMELLRGRGLRMTPQRRAIVAAVLHAQGHISPTVITRKIQSEMPGVNASTVYRTLTLLEEVGVLQHSHLESGAEYHRAEEAEHIHLVCGSCGEDDPLSLKEADALQGLIRRHHGFEADLTHFAITGLCKACAAAAS